MQTVLEQALEYASYGWKLLPGANKRPFMKWAEASSDVDTVTKMFEKWPQSEIICITGPSRLAVLDLDYYKGPVAMAVNSYATWEFMTPRGGRQLVFADPESKVPTTAGAIEPNVDTRGVGGVVVLPSVNSPGRKWVNRSGFVKPWPEALSEKIGTARPTVPVVDEDGTVWSPVQTDGERLPNEICPGSIHWGEQATLGVRRMPDGTYKALCWSGCDEAEVNALLVAEGRYTAQELGLPAPRESLFISRDDLMAIEPPLWMIDPYLQEGALIQLTAKFNTGKTFVALNWALSLGNEGKRVLYVALEGLVGLKKRVIAWEEHNARSGSGVLYSPRGYILNLLSESSVGGFVRDVEAEGGFDLVVIDNLGEAMPGDENDSATVAQAMHALNQIRSASGGAVLDLHNSGHGATTRARGHSKMLDVHDTVVYLENIEGSLNGLKVICGKERNAERFVSRRAQLKSVGNSLVAVMGGKAVAESNPIYNAIKLGHDTRKKIAKYLDVEYTTLIDRIKPLVETGDLTELKLGNEITYHCVWEAKI